MTSLLSLFQSAPLALGAFAALITLIAILAPWSKLMKFSVLTLLIGFACVVLFFEHWVKRFASWMRKREPWYDDFDKWMTENARL